VLLRTSEVREIVFWYGSISAVDSSAATGLVVALWPCLVLMHECIARLAAAAYTIENCIFVTTL